MATTPFIQPRDGGNNGPFQKVITLAQDNTGTDIGTSNPFPVDITGDITATEGGQQKVFVLDDNGLKVLEGMLKELKKMNLHLSILTDINIRNTEVE
jgi:hypothetical protein